VAEGAVEFELPAGDSDSIAVRIVFGQRYPAVAPVAYDAAGRWGPDPDRHILRDHQFCLYLGGVDEPNLRAPGGFGAWMIDLLLFLHQQLVCDAIQGRRFPGPEWPHGERAAYSQHLLEILQAFPEPERRDAWRAVRLSQVGRNWSCPCGSSRKLKRCHGAAVEELQRVARRAGLNNASYDELREIAHGS